MADAEDFKRIKQDWAASRDARAATIGQMLNSFRENIEKFRRENHGTAQEIDKMLGDFHTKSKDNTAQINSIAEQTATFDLDNCHRDQERARQVYQLFEEVARMLRSFAEENEHRAEEISKAFAQFSERDVDRKEEVAELCRTGYNFLESLSRRRHERQEDVQVILGQLRLENRQRLEWMSLMLARLRADERDRAHEFEIKDGKISRDVRSIIEQFASDRDDAVASWTELKSAIELCRSSVRPELPPGPQGGGQP